jgi:tetratricopeptide (TPR) repeat protein
VCFRRARQLDPKEFGSVYGLAYSLDRIGKTTEANSLFAEAATLTDKDMSRTCIYHIGRNLLRDESPAEADREFSRLPNDPAAVHQRARLRIMNGRFHEAWPMIQLLQRLDQNDLETQLLAVHAEQGACRRDAAAVQADRLERSRQSLRLVDHWEYLQPIRERYGMAAELAHVQALSIAGNTTEAADRFEAIVRDTDPRITIHLLARGAELQLRAGRAERAVELLMTILETAGHQPIAVHLLGDAWHALGDFQKACEFWKHGNALRPRSESHQRLAEWYERNGNPVQARREAGLAFQVLGIEAYRNNELERALSLLLQAVEFVPNEAQAWFYLGETRRALSQEPEARIAFERCVELAPNHGRALDRLAGVARLSKLANCLE